MQFTEELLAKLRDAERERDLAELNLSEVSAKLAASQSEVRAPACSGLPSASQPRAVGLFAFL
jgi:hypothetical protein